MRGGAVVLNLVSVGEGGSIRGRASEGGTSSKSCLCGGGRGSEGPLVLNLASVGEGGSIRGRGSEGALVLNLVSVGEGRSIRGRGSEEATNLYWGRPEGVRGIPAGKSGAILPIVMTTDQLLFSVY